MKQHTTTYTLPTLLSHIARAGIFAIACAGVSVTAGCDQSEDPETEVAAQLEDAEVTMADALTAIDEDVTDGMVFEADFEMGVDDGFYTVVTVQGDLEVVYEVDARTGERVESERRAAQRDRAERARRFAHLRRRIAAAVRDAREQDQRFRPLRLRLRLAAAEDDARGRDRGSDEERLEVEVDLVDRRGRVRQIRRAL